MGADQYGVMGGVYSGAYRQAPWHGLGESKNAQGEVQGNKVQLPDGLRDAADILDVAGLNWTVEARNLADFMPGHEWADEHRVIVRTDNNRVLGTAGAKYGVLQNQKVGMLAEAILAVRSDARPVAAVELWGGKAVFVVIEFPELVHAVRGDGSKHDQATRYMGIYTSHDGTLSLGVRFMDLLWVCQNTYTPRAALSGITIRHTRNAGDIADAARATVEQMVTSFQKLDDDWDRLLQIPVTEATFEEAVVRKILHAEPGGDSHKQTAWETAYTGIMAEWKGYTSQATAFDAVAAVQGYEQHRAIVRGSSRDVATMRRLMRNTWPMTEQAYGLFSRN